MRHNCNRNVKAFLFLILTCFLLVFVSNLYAATIEEQGIYIENWDGNVFTSFGAKVLNDAGDPIPGLTDVTASDGTNTYSLGPDGDWYWTTQPYGSITGSLDISVASLGLTVATHELDKLDVVPLAQNIQYTSTSGHTISWDKVTFESGSEWDNGNGTLSDHAHRYALRFYNNSNSEFFRSNLLAGDILSYTLPSDVLLTAGDEYMVRVIAQMYDYEGEDINGENGEWFLESRSSSFASFTAAVPEPSTLMLFGIGLLGLTGTNRRKR